MARSRRKGNEARRRRNKIPFGQRLQKSYRRALQLLRLERDKRGRRREEHVFSLLKALKEYGNIQDAVLVDQWSWGDFVLKADCVALRCDWTFVPIQVKPSIEACGVFADRYRELCIRMYGALPVLITVQPCGFDNPQKSALALLHDINVWRGTGFDYQPWMRVTNKLFNMNKFPNRKPSDRIREFMSRHRDFFQNHTLRLGVLDPFSIH